MSDTRGGVHRGKDRVDVQAIDEPGDGGPRRPRHRPRLEVVSQWAAGSAGGQARDVLVPRPGMQAREGMEAGGR